MGRARPEPRGDLSLTESRELWPLQGPETRWSSLVASEALATGASTEVRQVSHGDRSLCEPAVLSGTPESLGASQPHILLVH